MIEQRSLYVMKVSLDEDGIFKMSIIFMKGFSRYECTHEILKSEESFFNGGEIIKGRRVSVICRNEAKS